MFVGKNVFLETLVLPQGFFETYCIRFTGRDSPPQDSPASQSLQKLPFQDRKRSQLILNSQHLPKLQSLRQEPNIEILKKSTASHLLNADSLVYYGMD